MKIRPTIFDSKTEREVFKSLRSRWSPRLTLYPSLPLSKIIQIDLDEFEPKERSFYYKANVDYTFCLANGQPILSVEFDGIGGGFSRDGVYIPKRATSDRYRKLKMDFKLRLANSVSYPLIVVSYDEVESLDQEESFTILDSIVGQVLAKREFQERVEEFMEMDREKIESMNDYDRHEHIQDLVLTAEVLTELENDPIAKKASQYQVMCFDLGVTRHEVSWLEDPPLPDIKDMFDVEGLKARVAAFKDVVRFGCRIVLKTPKIPVIYTTWVRNFEGCGISPLSMAENICEYLAFKRAYHILKGK